MVTALMLLVAAAPWAWGAGPVAPALNAHPGLVRCYTAQGRVRDMAVDRERSRVYSGTDGGLVIHATDGSVVSRIRRTEGLGCHNIRALAVAPDGTLWLATAGGMARWSRDEWSFFSEADGLNDGLVNAVACDAAGNVYAGTQKGAARLDGGRFRPLNDPHEFARKPTMDVMAAPDGSVWFAKENGLTRLKPDGTWETHQRDYERVSGGLKLPSGCVWNVVAGAGGQVWAAIGGGAAWFDGAQWSTWEPLTVAPGSPLGRRMATLAVDADGALWTGYGDWTDGGSGGGAAVWTPAGMRRLTEADGLSSARINRIRAGADGSVWLATDRGACRVADGRADVFLDKGELPSCAVRDIVRVAPGEVLVLTASGLVRFVNGEPGGEPEGLGVAAECVASAGGQVAVGNVRDGLSWRRDGAWVPDPTFRNCPVYSIGVSGDGAWWVLDSTGLHRGMEGAWRAVEGWGDGTERAGCRVYGAARGAWVLQPGAGEVTCLPLGLTGFRVVTRVRLPRLSFVVTDSAGGALLGTTESLTDLLTAKSVGLPAVRGLRLRSGAMDVEGRLWLGTRRDGLWVREGNAWRPVLLNGRPFPDEITSLCFEADDVLWVGTGTEGAFRMEGITGLFTGSPADGDER